MTLTYVARMHIYRKLRRLRRVFMDEMRPEADQTLAAVVHYRLTRILWRHLSTGQIQKFPDEMEVNAERAAALTKAGAA